MTETSRRAKYMIAASAILATSLESVDGFILNVSLDHVRGSLSAGVDEITWVLTAYLVASSIALPFTGWLTRKLGQRNLFLASTALFTLSSMAAGAAPTLELLILARFFQGLGGGCLLPLSQTIMLQTFPGKQRGMAMAVWGIGVKLGPIAAPLLGGWISDNWGWRWIFYINLPVGIFAIFLAGRFIPGPVRDDEANPPAKLDAYGAMLLVLGIAALQLMLDLGQGEDWFESPLITHLAIIGVSALVTFTVHALRHPAPIVNLRMFGNPVFAGGTILMFAMAFGQHSSLMLSPLFTRSVMDYTAFLAGLALAPGGAAHLLIMPFTGMLLNRVDPRWFMSIGCALTALSMYQLSILDAEATFAQVTWPRFIQGGGFGLVFVALTTASLSSVPNRDTAAAAGMFNLLRNIGGSVGIALIRTSLERDAQTIQARLVVHVSPYDPDVYQRLQEHKASFLASGADAFTAQKQALGALRETVRHEALLQAFLHNYLLLTGLFLLLIPLFLMLRRAQPEAR